MEEKLPLDEESEIRPNGWLEGHRREEVAAGGSEEEREGRGGEDGQLSSPPRAPSVK
jgi:hypothetical protein